MHQKRARLFVAVSAVVVCAGVGTLAVFNGSAMREEPAARELATDAALPTDDPGRADGVAKAIGGAESVEIMATRQESAGEPTGFDGAPEDGGIEVIAEGLVRSPLEALPAALEAMRGEMDDEQLLRLAALIGSSAEAANADEAILLALDFLADEDDARRHAALLMMKGISVPSESVVSLVSDVCQVDENPQVKIAGISALNEWLMKGPYHADLICDGLIETIAINEDPVVRGFAIQSMALQSRELPEQAIVAMAESTISDDSSQNRGIAALGLGGVKGEWQELALETLQGAYLNETDLELRRTLLTHIVRSAEKDAVGILEQLPADNSILEQDIQDYIEIVSSVEDFDADQVYSMKFKRDSENGTIIGLADGAAHGH